MSYNEETGFAVNWTMAVGLTLIFLMVVAVVVGAGIRPWLIEREREAVEESRQYRIGVVDELQTAMEGYLEIEDDRIVAEQDGDDDLVTVYESQQANHLQNMNRVFNQLGGIDELRGDPDFQEFITFYEEYNR